MANVQLTGYIQKELKKGFSEEQIRQALVKSGWAITDIDEAFKTVKVVPEEIKPKKLEPEQALKEIIGEEVEKVTEEPVKTEESWFNCKKRLIFILIGLFLLIIFYYVYEYIQS